MDLEEFVAELVDAVEAGVNAESVTVSEDGLVIEVTNDEDETFQIKVRKLGEETDD